MQPRAVHTPAAQPAVRSAAVGVLASVLVTAGCGLAAGESSTCVSWVEWATPAEAVEDAELVATARVLTRDGTAELYGVDAHVWIVTTEGLEPLRGEAPAETLRVISTPVTCEDGGPYPDGDPLDTDDTLVLFLTRDEAGDDWRTQTPRQGSVPVGPAGGLPAAWTS